MADLIGITGLQFFGAMTASISHEIKNRMAIINEQAGLLADFIQMAHNGRPLDSQRLERLAEAVKTQVCLADTIIKKMNQFAHSADHLFQSVNLEELIGLAAELFKRKADNCCMRIEIVRPEKPATAETSPFLLMNLIWLVIEPLFAKKHFDQPLTLRCEKQNSRTSVSIALGETEPSMELILSNDAEKIGETLGATLHLSESKKILTIELPAKPQERLSTVR